MSQGSQPSILTLYQAIESKTKCWVFAVVHKATGVIEVNSTSRIKYLLVHETGESYSFI